MTVNINNVVRSQLLKSGYSLDKIHRYVNQAGQSKSHVTRAELSKEFSKVSSGGFTRAEVTDVLRKFGFVAKRDLGVNLPSGDRISDSAYKSLLGPGPSSK